ncbi:nuclear transport factor 2 family protein [Dyella sp. 333MFSha]|uniref:nuclear transport factor 2 family protein n=1 Tax=Dyella sp. 333MFSha TaxID=1798240 RepID=UPI000891B013|nr:nuclear transport factor 2 family protein [Dyella sp. 333MFSha]SDG67378.1 hypothetical protein SAMN04515659_3307 [Dyella sp. 333MFSha]
MSLHPAFSAFALLLTLPCFAADAPKAEIQHAVDTFQAALKAHDAKSVSSLFLNDNISWYTSLGDASFTSVKARHSEVTTAYKAGTLKQFTDFIGSGKVQVEERFHNIRIDTDGTVASVYFDFDFLADGKIANHGAETWQMIHTPDGWKIAAMLYSSNF